MILNFFRSDWRSLIVLLGCLSGGMLIGASVAVAETVNLPLTIDYPLLRSLAVATAFTDPGEATNVLDEGGGCRRITISAPSYRSKGSHLQFEVKAEARLGTSIGNNCLAPVEWQGYVVFEQRPRIETQSWQLYFETLDSTLYDRNHRPARVVGIIWELINTPIHEYLAGYNPSAIRSRLEKSNACFSPPSRWPAIRKSVGLFGLLHGIRCPGSAGSHWTPTGS